MSIAAGNGVSKTDNYREPLISKGPRTSNALRHLGSQKKFVQKISDFFATIPNRYESFKERRRLAFLDKAEKKATTEILRGLKDNRFADVHQGLKRLHKADEWYKIKGRSAGITSNYVTVILEDITGKLSKHSVKHLQDFVNGRQELVDDCSDIKKPFHKILKALERIRLVRSDYVTSRENRIKNMDRAIKESLKNLLGNNIKRETLKRESKSLIKEIQEFKKMHEEYNGRNDESVEINVIDIESTKQAAEKKAPIDHDDKERPLKKSV